MKVLVLGASEGIGHFLSEKFCQTGLTVTGVARSPRPDITDWTHPDRYTHFQFDFSQIDGEVSSWIKQQNFDVTVFSASVTDDVEFSQTDRSLQRNIFQTNVLTYIELVHSILANATTPHLFLFLSTESALQPKPSLSLYSASKAALLAFARSLAIEYRDSPHSFASLILGPTATPYYLDLYTKGALRKQMSLDEYIALGMKTHFPSSTNLSLVPLEQIWKVTELILTNPKDWNGAAFRLDHGTIAST